MSAQGFDLPPPPDYSSLTLKLPRSGNQTMKNDRREGRLSIREEETRYVLGGFAITVWRDWSTARRGDIEMSGIGAHDSERWQV